MGNNASSPKTDGSGSASPGGRPSQHHHQHPHHSHSQHYQNNHQHQQQSQQYQQHGQSQAQQPQKTSRNPALVQNQRVAVPPEQSMTHAQGSTTSSSASRSIPSRPYPSAAEAAVAASASPARNINSPTAASSSSRPRPAPATVADTIPPPSKPVAVPQPAGTASIPIASAAAVAATTSAYSAEHVEQAAAKPIDYDPALSHFHDNMDAPMMAQNSIQDLSYLTRPPRLPLPIEEEVHTPGSPIMAAAKEDELIEDIETLDNEGMTHRSSTLSSVINEEDEEELRVDKTRPTVPTRLEWLRGGEKVYVTGTIFQWNKKQRMHPVEGRPGVFATTINVLPGTHHIRFLVDNQMETSRDLPTTVDFGNNLVNYIEVAPQSTPPKESAGAPPPAALGAPVVAHGGADTGAPSGSAAGAVASIPAGYAASVSQQQVQQYQQQQAQQHVQQQVQQQIQQQQTSLPAQTPPSSSATATAPPQPQDANQLRVADSSVELTSRAPKWKDVPEPSAFSHDLPQYLVDYDQPDESPDFHSAAVATEILSMPPSLPGFLGKPILNAATLIKDDNSVLNMPNYTILNHLATSSIKNNILAVSATTRYKAKFVTVIIYKPTGGDDKH